MHKGFPEGLKSLEAPPEYYDAQYRLKGLAAQKPWHAWSNADLIWRPASTLMRSPVLDLGCGMGQVAEMCADMGIEYAAGIDSSSIAIALALARMGVNFEGRFIVGDIREVVNASLSSVYEAAVLLEVLEHVYEDIELIEAVPEGKTVVASVPNFHCEGHVRWFGNALEVVRRYERALNLDCVTYTTKGQHTWWIFRGVRR